MTAKKEYPIGLAKKIEETKETLPAIKVKNEVFWVNKNIQIPFKLVEGKPTKLALMVAPKEKSGYHLEVNPLNKRTATIGRVIFQDNRGNFYRDVDIKGCGLIEWRQKRYFYFPEVGKIFDFPQLETPRGLAEPKNLFQERDISDKFLEKGIRTYVYLAIIKLKELVDKDGKLISAEEAKKERMINANREPMMAIRAFGTKARIKDLYYIKNKTLAIDDAKELLGKEFKKKITDDQDYFLWFAKMLGKQVALVHKNGWAHNLLTPHNITLDCRIVDLDTVKALAKDIAKKKKQMQIDYRSAAISLKALFKNLPIKNQEKVLEYGLRLFSESYSSVLGKET